MNEKEIMQLPATGKRYKVNLGEGLFVLVMPSGRKSYVSYIRHEGKGTDKTIGSVATYSLREAWSEHKKNCGDTKIIMSSSAGRSPQFEVVFESWYETYKKKLQWGKGHSDKVESSFRLHVLPLIGTKKISEIKPTDIYNVLENMEQKNLFKTVADTKSNIGRVFAYAILNGWCETDPVDVVRRLHRNPPVRKQGFAHLPWRELGQFQILLDRRQPEGTVKNATLLLMLTALRTIELRSAEWSWIDWDDKTITIPSEFMKGTRLRKGNEDMKHVCYLSDYAIEIFCKQQLITGDKKHVFFQPASRVNPFISEASIQDTIKRIGYYDAKANKARHTGHGFRKCFSTCMNENKNLFGANAREAIDMCLAHVQKDTVEAAYNKAQYEKERREIMDWYGAKMISLKEEAYKDAEFIKSVLTV